MSADIPSVQSVIHHFQKVSSSTPNAPALQKMLQQQEHFSHTLDLGPAFYIILDYTEFRYRYVSASVTDVLGYEVAYPMSKSFDFLGETGHPDDARQIVQLWGIITPYCKTLPVEVFRQAAYTVDCRMRHADGRYRRILQQTVALNVDDRGQLQYELIKLTDITHWQKQSPVCGIITTPDPQYNLVCFPSENLRIQGRVFSRAEQRVLELLAHGERSKEIASRLNLSPHTVDTHRRNMLRKTRSRNVQELLRFAYLSGAL